MKWSRLLARCKIEASSVMLVLVAPGRDDNVHLADETLDLGQDQTRVGGGSGCV